MRKVNTDTLTAETWTAPDGESVISGKEVSEALGRLPKSEDPLERHPFDVEIQNIPPGVTATFFHSHSEQWEFYHVLSGGGSVRDATGTTEVGPGDAFVFKPREAHQLSAGAAGMSVYVIADNPRNDEGHLHEPIGD